ncbi:acetyl-CoA carboxylase biotin carboxyl carrier protein [Pseudomonas sp. LB3P38]|uniref:acetyl-CoA carboxylase biotin carboxyl carrier protein n=1 Tax=Pseudomonas lyxosi TaxID=3398358 RepID=UPI0039EED1D7
MNIELIERLIAIVERSQLAEMEYTEDGERVRIIRKPQSVQQSTSTLKPGGASSLTAVSRVTDPTIAPSNSEVPSDSGLTVKAGMAGVFYRSSAPDKPNFVSVGDLVEEGQTLGILEAMKMLNPIEADTAGRIVQILQDDGTSVEAGAGLFIIQSVD